MNKGQAQNSAYVTRTGSFATHASRTGRNLLGWEENEVLTPEQQLDALKKVKRELQANLTEMNAELKATVPFGVFKAKHAQREELKARVTEIEASIREVRQHIPRNRDDLGAFIIEIIKERVTKPEWEMIYQEAKRRYAAQSVELMKEREGE